MPCGSGSSGSRGPTKSSSCFERASRSFRTGWSMTAYTGMRIATMQPLMVKMAMEMGAPYVWCTRKFMAANCVTTPKARKMVSGTVVQPNLMRKKAISSMRTTEMQPTSMTDHSTVTVQKMAEMPEKAANSWRENLEGRKWGKKTRRRQENKRKLISKGKRNDCKHTPFFKKTNQITTEGAGKNKIKYR